VSEGVVELNVGPSVRFTHHSVLDGKPDSVNVTVYSVGLEVRNSAFIAGKDEVPSCPDPVAGSPSSHSQVESRL
jgi:hypothetical protein